MAEMPYSDGNGFCLAAPLAVAQVTLCRPVRLQDETGYTSTASSAALIDHSNPWERIHVLSKSGFVASKSA